MIQTTKDKNDQINKIQTDLTEIINNYHYTTINQSSITSLLDDIKNYLSDSDILFNHDYRQRYLCILDVTLVGYILNQYDKHFPGIQFKVLGKLELKITISFNPINLIIEDISEESVDHNSYIFKHKG